MGPPPVPNRRPSRAVAKPSLAIDETSDDDCVIVLARRKQRKLTKFVNNDEKNARHSSEYVPGETPYGNEDADPALARKAAAKKEKRLKKEEEAAAAVNRPESSSLST
jgi:hypothetical protein